MGAKDPVVLYRLRLARAAFTRAQVHIDRALVLIRETLG